MSKRAYVSARGLTELGERLSERDLAIVAQVAALRLMSARQIQALHFPVGEHQNAGAATRARQRVVARLLRERLLTALERRVGGIRAGSAGLIVALGPVGKRLLSGDGRQRPYEPSHRFVDHTLAVAQLVTDLSIAAQIGQLDLLSWQAEPDCWRTFLGFGGERRVLRPDAFVVLGAGDYELRWFVEVDRSSESLPVIRRKCRLYADYYQAGDEQAAAGGVFPRVCWVAPDSARAERLRASIAADRALPERLFVVTTSDAASRTMQEVKT
jgi:hypothetical protein